MFIQVLLKCFLVPDSYLFYNSAEQIKFVTNNKHNGR